MVHEPLRSLGFDDGGIRWLMRTFSMVLLREWTDIALAATEKFDASFFKRSPQAWLVDNLKNAAAGRRTPPDWWHDQRRVENRARENLRQPTAPPACELPNLPDESRQAFEGLAGEMFSLFTKFGQPETTAKTNAEKFARECAQRGDVNLAEPLRRLFNS